MNRDVDALNERLIERILTSLPQRTIGVLGDLFLDRYLDLDATLTEPSIETGLDAFQVVRVRSCPGAAGTVINNLASLGTGRIIPISVIGDDGDGYELRQTLGKMTALQMDHVTITPLRRTPTYTKPMLASPGQAPRELNRLDIRNRLPLPRQIENAIIQSLDAAWNSCDALLVLDQVREPETGVVTTAVRDHIANLAATSPDRIVIADSRERIGLFRGVLLKPNERECTGLSGPGESLTQVIARLSRDIRRPIVCTRGEHGMMVMKPESEGPIEVTAFSVTGPIDTVGAGDSSSAALACALASGASLVQAAAFANLIASITIQQIGTTGTATPEMVRQRWREVRT